MNKKKRLLAFAIGVAGIVLVGVVLGLTTNFWYIPFLGGNAPSFTDYPDYQRVLSSAEMKEDLLQLRGI